MGGVVDGECAEVDAGAVEVEVASAQLEFAEAEGFVVEGVEGVAVRVAEGE